MTVKKFIDEVIAEMKKVSWATKKEVVNYTVVVGIAVAIVSAVIWFCDPVFARLFHIILR